MTVGWVEGIDVSVFQGDIPQATWDAIYAAGQRVAVVGSAHPRPNTFALENLRRAKQAGFVLATYIVVWPGVPSANTVAVARQMCGEFWPELSFAAIDCETEGITEAQIFGMEQSLLAANARPVIYTARWFWRDKFGDSHAFAHLPLWNAWYDNDPDLDFPSAPYGGWAVENVMGEQYAGTVPYHGTTVDRNTFREGFLMATSPTQAQLLLAAGIFAQAAVECAKGNYQLTPTLRAQIKFLMQ